MIFPPLVKQTNKKNPAAKRNKERAFFFDPPPPPILHRGRVSIAVGAAAESAACGESLSRSAKEEGDGEETPPCQPSSKKKRISRVRWLFFCGYASGGGSSKNACTNSEGKKLKGRIASIIGSLRLASNPHPPRGYIFDAPHGSRALAESISRSRGPGRGVFS